MLRDDELTIDSAIVESLLARDAPDLADLSLQPLASSGSTNALFRLGDRYVVRLPRQRGGGKDIAKEARWTPKLGAALAVATPEIVVVGDPGFGYPEEWSVARWIEGVHPSPVLGEDPPRNERLALAEDLADVILALRAIEIPEEIGQELRGYRGGALRDFDPSVRRSLERCRQIDGVDLDLHKAEALWDQALTLPGADVPGPDRWYHGDLVAENLLTAGGRLVAVLDFGAASVGDPTVDLHGAWEILDAPAREAFAHRLGVGEAEWLRGRAWALGIALGAMSYYWHTMPRRRDDRLAMARNVLAE